MTALTARLRILAAAATLGLVVPGFVNRPVLADSSSNPAPSVTAAPASQTSPIPAVTGLNIAFDQIDRTISGGGTPPPMNRFDAEVAAIHDYQSASFLPSDAEINQELAMAAAQAALSFVPFGSTAVGIAQQAAARNAEKRIKELMGPDPGTYTRYFFYNGLARIELRSLVVIIRPDRHQQIYLNPVKKTYRIVDSSSTPTPAADTTETPPPNPAKSETTVTGSQTDAATINGQETVGFRTDATTTLSGGIDPCVDGTYRATQLEYFAQGPEPIPGSVALAQGFYALTLPQDCYVNLSPTTSGAAPLYQQMYVYRLTSVVRDAALAARPPPTQKQQEQANMMKSMFGSVAGPGPNYMRLSERGNIRALTPADAGLFEIPADYTETQ